MIKRSCYAWMFSLVITFALILPFSVSSQEDDSKAIKAEVFLKQRPAKSSRNTARYKPVSKRDPKPEPIPAGMAPAQVGLTIWRYREAKNVDKSKDLVEEDEGQDWILERINEETLLSPGQKVRLSFESLSRTGYLYVIDREQYVDGTFGDPKLIFPTQRSKDRNKVEPGRPIYIPSATGRFRIRPSASEKPHVAESLTMIISPKPLIDENALESEALKVQPSQFDIWLKQWQSTPTQFEMEAGVGLALTRVEQSAARLDQPLLSQEDPGPQTIYNLLAKAEDPILLTVLLKFVR